MTMMRQGCGAGNGLADILFAVAFAKVKKRLLNRLEEQGLPSTCQPHGLAQFFNWKDGQAVGKFPLQDVSYADDLAIVIADVAGSLVEKVGKVAEHTWELFAVSGLALNWGGTKTAALFRWHGKGANEVKRDLALRMGNDIVLKCGNATATLTCVNWYRHVGTGTSVNADMGKEVSTRCAITVAVARPLTAKIFRNPQIRLDVKSTIMRSLVFSRHLFQCGTWPALNKTEYRRFASVTMQLYRMLLPPYELGT